MSDYHVHYYGKHDPVDYRGVIKDNWVTDNYGFVDVSTFVENHFRFGHRQTQEVLKYMRPYCVINRFPDEVMLVKEQDIDDE